jgi:hypothetical protein
MVEFNDQAASEDYSVPQEKVVYCDCVLSQNGLGLVGRICDCMADPEELSESWCRWPACSCGREKCEPWRDEKKPEEYSKMEWPEIFETHRPFFDARGRMHLSPINKSYVTNIVEQMKAIPLEHD